MVVTYSIQFQIQDGQLNDFQPPTTSTMNSNFTQDMGVIIYIPIGAIDQHIDQQGIQNLQMLYFMADQALSLKIVPTGGDVSTTMAFQLQPNIPSLLSVQNIIGLYCSNSTSSISKLTLKGVG